MAGLGLRAPQAGSSHSVQHHRHEQFTVCNRSEESEKRIHLAWRCFWTANVLTGVELGNSLVYGVPLRPHVEATAIALLALQDEQRIEMVQKSLSWLRQNVASVDSVSSLAWCILTLFVYQESVEPLKNRLATIMETVARSGTMQLSPPRFSR